MLAFCENITVSGRPLLGHHMVQRSKAIPVPDPAGYPWRARARARAGARRQARLSLVPGRPEARHARTRSRIYPLSRSVDVDSTQDFNFQHQFSDITVNHVSPSNFASHSDDLRGACRILTSETNNQRLAKSLRVLLFLSHKINYSG